MRTNRHGAIVLNQTERRDLARYLAARTIFAYAECFEWEDLPNLDRDGIEALVTELRGLAEQTYGTEGQFHRGVEVVGAVTT
jgi:hypothetical protein